MYYTRSWGLKADFYQGQNLEKYLYSGYKKNINFTDPQEMDKRLPTDNFSDRWEGQLLIPQDGQYTFYMYADDGGRVFIDGDLLFAGTWYEGETFKKISLSKGPHTISLEHYQAGGPAALKLSWSYAGVQKQIIPAKYLRH